MSEPRDREPALHLRIEKPIYGGAGLARHQGKAIFVPYTLPGELVSATVTHSKASFAEAFSCEILEASPQRTTPPCPYFGVCGGCHYQHAGYPAQLAIKAAILEETLTRARLSDLPTIVTHASEPFGYRNRVRLHLDPATSALGYRERGSHRLLAVTACPIAAPEIERALGPLSEVCSQQQCGRTFSQLELSVNHDGSQLLLALWLRTDSRTASQLLAQLCDALKPSLPTLCGAGVHAAPLAQARTGAASRAGGGRERFKSSKRPPGSRPEQAGPLNDDDTPGALIATWGTPQMIYRVARIDYRVSLGAFFQVNRALIATLVELATNSRKGRLAWDLYAGVGLFSRVLGASFEQVMAVEGAPTSYLDLQSHLLKSPHQAVRSSTLEFLRRQARWPNRTGSAKLENTRPDFVLVDPPRAGLGEEVTRLLAQIGPANITYVSCDPATLSRDLRVLVDSGYKLDQLHLIDLFPQTFHLETVAMLSLA